MRTLLLAIMVVILISALLLSGVACTKTVYVMPSQTLAPSISPTQAPTPTPTKAPTPVSTPTSTSRQWYWVPSPGNIVSGGTYAYFPLNGAYVAASRTLSLSWSADASLDCFILTQNQYNNFKSNLGIVSSSIASGSGASGTIIANIQNSDTYYAVLINISVFESVKLYQAVLTEE